MKLIDLSRVFDSDMPVYPDDPVAEIKQVAFFDKHGYNDFTITTGMHVGTHMDAPLHMLSDGAFISDIDIKSFFGRGRLIDARGKSVVDQELLSGVEVEPGDVVVVLTGWGANFKQPSYYLEYPEITEDFAHRAVELGVKIVGMDTPSPDRQPFKVHKILLGNNLLIVENLTNLERLLDVEEFEVIALPPRLRTEAAPVRVVAKIKD